MQVLLQRIMHVWRIIKKNELAGYKMLQDPTKTHKLYTMFFDGFSDETINLLVKSDHFVYPKDLEGIDSYYDYIDYIDGADFAVMFYKGVNDLPHGASPESLQKFVDRCLAMDHRKLVEFKFSDEYDEFKSVLVNCQAGDVWDRISKAGGTIDASVDDLMDVLKTIDELLIPLYELVDFNDPKYIGFDDKYRNEPSYKRFRALQDMNRYIDKIKPDLYNYCHRKKIVNKQFTAK